MSLADRLAAAKLPTRGPGCSIARILATIPTEDADALKAALDDPALPGTVIANVLREEGHTLTSHTVQRHRRNDCACGMSK